MKRKKKRDNRNGIYIGILTLFIFGWFYFFIGGNITGFSILELEDGYVLRNFDGLQDFSYDSDLLVIDNSGVKMKFNETNQTYPSSAYLQTIDIVVDGDVTWEYIDSDYNLNGQDLKFGYSIDQGANWNELNTLNLSGVDSSTGTIRFAAEFISDGSSTPQIISLKFVYRVLTQDPLVEEVPLNETANLTEEEEVSSPPVVSEPIELEPLPLETVPVKDLPISTKKKIYHYLEETGQLDLIYDLPKDTEVAFDFNDGEIIIELVSENEIFSSLTIRRFVDRNILPMGNLQSLDGRLEEINVDEDLNDNLGGAILKSYYTDEEVEANNINESTLRMYTLEEGDWVPLYSGVDTRENFVWANPDHFSVFGVFGLVNNDGLGGVVISDEAIIVEEYEEEEEEEKEEVVDEFDESVKEGLEDVDSGPTGYSIVTREEEDVGDYGVIAFLVGVFFLFSIFLYTFLAKRAN